jgi:hypothetical protein
MPTYYVYDRQTGDIVHTHESVDAISGTSLRSSPEDVLALVDHPDKATLEVTEVEDPARESERAVRIDLETKQLVLRTDS